VLSASVGPVDGRCNQLARWVDYYLGRQGGPRAHPTGQPSAMAPQRRGAVAAPPPLARHGKGREKPCPASGPASG
jgi:hypothetical protein